MDAQDGLEPVRLLEFNGYCGTAPGPDERFLPLTALARHMFRMPSAMVNLIDDRTLWPVAEDGIALGPIPREQSICNLVMSGIDSLVLPDLAADPAFKDSAAVTGPLALRFYAGAPLRSPAGHVLGVFCVMDRQPRPDFDASARRSLEMLADIIMDQLALQRAQREAQRNLLMAERISRSHHDFLATLDREVRSPLDAMLGFSQMLAQEHLPEPLADYARTLHGTARDLGTIFRDAIGYARMESTALRLENVDFPIQEMALHAIRSAGRIARRKGVALRHSFAPDLPARVKGDPIRIQQVLSILLGNAVRFTHRGSIELAVTATMMAGSPALRFQVKDSGQGVPESLLDRLFDPFVLRASADEGKGEGSNSGLSLATARYLVQVMGGEIGYQPGEPKGSIFWFHLPLVGVG